MNWWSKPWFDVWLQLARHALILSLCGFSCHVYGFTLSTITNAFNPNSFSGGNYQGTNAILFSGGTVSLVNPSGIVTTLPYLQDISLRSENAVAFRNTNVWIVGQMGGIFTTNVGVKKFQFSNSPPSALSFVSNQQFGSGVFPIVQATDQIIPTPAGGLAFFYHDNHGTNSSMRVWLGYQNPAGTWSTNFVDMPGQVDGTLVTVSTAVAVHPDGAIWCFYHRDQQPQIDAVRVTESAGTAALSSIPSLISFAIDGEYGPDNELPDLVAQPDQFNNSIRLAYQRKHTHIFSGGPPFWKGAYVGVASVPAGASPSPITFISLDTYVERISGLGMVVDSSGKVTLLYNPIDSNVGVFQPVRYSTYSGGIWTTQIIEPSKPFIGSSVASAGMFYVSSNVNTVRVLSGDSALTPSSGSIFWTSRNAAQNNTFVSICWSPALHLFCAISPDGTQRVQTSTDGVTWTGRTAAESNGWAAVCWSQELGIFVAVAGDGVHQVMTSTDGFTWTPQTAGAVSTWRNVVWSKELGIFCAVASTGAIEAMTSPDGINWTPHTAATSGLIGLCWAPELGLFVAGGGADAHRLMTSPDGSVWTDRTAATMDDWLSIAWSPSLHLLVAVADTSNTGFNQRVMTSPDGINWTSHPPPEANDFSSVCWAPELGLFCAVSNTGTNRSMVSSDGSNWTMVPAAAQNFWYAVCWSPDLRRFVAGSWNGTQRLMTADSRIFYIDYGAGDDTFSGVTKTEAWKLHPFMAGFGGTYSHVAGDRFIFKGGVTWPVICFRMDISSGGNSSVRDYYGADTNWFTGGSFSRPLFDFQNTLINPAGFWPGSGVHVTASYIDFDNIEMARHRAPLINSPGTNSYGCATIVLDGTVNEFTLTNSVIRDWSIPTPVSAGQDGGGGGGIYYINGGGETNLVVTHCSLNQANSLNGVKSGTSINIAGIVEYCTINDTPNGFIGAGTCRYNHIYNIPNGNDPAAHSNATEFFAPTTTYGNLIHDLGSGTAAIYHVPDWSGGSSIDLIYNNVVYNCGNQAAVQLDTGGAHTATIGARIYNNTLIHPSHCIRVAERGTGPYGTLDVQNNLLITSGVPVACCNPSAGNANITSYTFGSNVVQTATVAAEFGFTAANYYQPTLSFGLYHDGGVDFSSLFTVDRLGVTRTVPWDIGAYEFTGVGPPARPTNVRILLSGSLRAGQIRTRSP